MGRNAAIKHFVTTPAEPSLELVETRHGRLSVILEILRSPWVMRASELPIQAGSWSTKHVGERVEVGWDPERHRPGSFVRAEETWRVDSVVQFWSVERIWWDPRRRISRRVWRVLARGGVYDLAFDRLTQQWLLLGIED